MPDLSKPAPILYLHAGGLDGDVFEFSSTRTRAYTALEGWDGFGIPDPEWRTVQRNDGGGSYVRSLRLKERELFIPLVIWGESQAECLANWDALVSALNPRVGESSVLEVRRAGVPPRFINVVYKSGLGGTFGTDFRGWYYKVGLTLIAHDPYFWESDTAISWNVRGNYKPFISGGDKVKEHSFFPVILSPSVVNGSREITIIGDVDSSPVWQITGAVTDVRVTNKGTGESFSITGTIAPGETVTVDTTVFDIYSQNDRSGSLWDRVTTDSKLFRLGTGRHTIEVTGSGMDERSEIALIYKPRYVKGI